MRRGFLLPKSKKDRKDVSPLDAVVLSRHASHLAVLLRDWSVLFLCREQERREAIRHRFKDIVDQTLGWFKPLETAGMLPVSEVPPSTYLLRRFALNVEVWHDAAKSGNEEVAAASRIELNCCLVEGLKAFVNEAKALNNIEDVAEQLRELI